MLDLSCPLTPYIFQASFLMGEMMNRGQKMSVSPSLEREEFLPECIALLDEMRELADQFQDRAPSIHKMLDEYERAIRQLAALNNGKISDDRRNGEGCCVVCGTPITKFECLVLKPSDERWIVQCDECIKPLMDAHEKLDTQGFCTWLI